MTKTEARLIQNSYTDEIGVVRCNTCHEPLMFKGYRCLCKCEQEELDRGEDFRKEEMRKKGVEQRKRNSFLSDRYGSVYFKDVRITENNRNIVQKAKNYVSGSYDAITKNIGVYLYGENSSGKTHLTAAMCNELIEKGYSCLYTNLTMIMKNSSLFEGENEIIDRIKTEYFLFIDDLGAEFMGREGNPQGAKFAERVLREIVNSRYNAQFPTIFSSNYSIQELADVLQLDQAIVDRINEMSTTVWELSGDDFRTENLNEKTDVVKKMGI